MGLVRPRCEPLLRPPGRAAGGGLHHPQRRDAEQIEVGWWPGDARYPNAAFFAYAYPAPEGFAAATLAPSAARWDATLGEYILDWDDIRARPDLHGYALEFARSAVAHACAVCRWDPDLSISLEGIPPPVA